MITKYNKRYGFTLLELLVVIAIIGILVALLLGGIQKVMERSKATKARTDAKAIENAIKNYHTEYNRWPGGWPDADSLPPLGLVVTRSWTMPAPILNYISVTNNTTNPKHILFWESTSTNDVWKDPWGSYYQVTIKVDADAGGDPVTVRSPGPDKGFGTSDDISNVSEEY